MGRWFEMEGGVGKPAYGTVGMDPPVLPPAEYLYFTADYWIASTFGIQGHEIWRFDLRGAGATAAERFRAVENCIYAEDDAGFSMAGVSLGTSVRDMCTDRDGNLLALRVNLGGDVFVEGGGTRMCHSIVRKYDRHSGDIIWTSPDILRTIRDAEPIKSPLYTVYIGSPGTEMAVSDDHVCVVQCGSYQSSADNLYHRYVWFIFLDRSTGEILGTKRLDAGYQAQAISLYQYHDIYGVTWDPDTGDFWAAGTYWWQNDGTTWPGDYTCRLYKVNEGDLTDTDGVDVQLDGHTKTIGLGLSYHPAGKLLMPIWHESAVGGDGEMGLAAYDLTAGTTAHDTYGDPIPHGTNLPYGSHNVGGNCGICRTGRGIGMYEIQRETGLGDAGVETPDYVYLCDGKRIWRCTIGASSVSCENDFVVADDFDIYALVRRANGDLVHIKPWLKTVGLFTPLQMTLTVRNESDGSVKWTQTKDFSAQNNLQDIAARQPFETVPYEWMALVGEEEMPWCAMALGAER